MKRSPGRKFRDAVMEEHPLQLPGVINATVALIAEKAGFHALYLSGAGVANAAYGIPDIGLTTLDNVLEETRRITDATQLPLLVDIDTGFGELPMIQRTIKEMIRAGAAGVHLEDQVQNKRCGHLPNKELVSTDEMCDRIRAAVEAKTDPDFVLMARTDALAVEGLDAALKRAVAYREAGADMLFPEALSDLKQVTAFKDATSLPVLVNLTEFGKTPLWTMEEIAAAGADIGLYPLSAFRAMNRAAEELFKEIRSAGTQKGMLDRMQTRQELYDLLRYEEFMKM